MRRRLLLVSIVFLIVFMLATSLGAFRYANSPALVLQVATLANLVGRPIAALIFSAVLVARFRDIWSRRIDISEPVTSGIAKVAQVTGLILLVVFYCVLAVVLYLRFGVPKGLAVELPTLFMFGPLLTSLPLGYVLFELGRLVDKDRCDADA